VKVTPEARILVPFRSLKVVDIPHLGDQLGVRTKYITVMVYDNEFIWGVHTRVEIVGNTRGREGF
jgi:hypothetical protein